MGVRDVIGLVFDLFRKGIIAVIFLSKYYLVQTSAGKKLYLTYKDWRYDTAFRHADIDFFRTAYAAPEQITHKINQNSFGYQYTQVGRIETGNFPVASVRFENYYVYTSLYEHFVNGREWEETAYYTMAFDQVDATDLGWSQISNYEALDTFFEELDDLYDSIESEGYVESELLKSAECPSPISYVLAPIRAHSEVFIDIDSDGELLLTDGRHRAAIARILSIEKIPVRILARHREWCRLRCELLRAMTTDGSAVSKHSLIHPEFSHIESRYDSALLAADIRERVDEGPIVEYDPGVSGALLHDLDRERYETIAVAKSDDQRRYLKWYAKFSGESIRTCHSSDLDGLKGKDCTLIALDPVDRNEVIDVVKRLNARRLLMTDSEPYRDRIDDGVELIELNR